MDHRITEPEHFARRDENLIVRVANTHTTAGGTIFGSENPVPMNVGNRRRSNSIGLGHIRTRLTELEVYNLVTLTYNSSLSTKSDSRAEWPIYNTEPVIPIDNPVEQEEFNVRVFNQNNQHQDIKWHDKYDFILYFLLSLAFNIIGFSLLFFIFKTNPTSMAKCTGFIGVALNHIGIVILLAAFTDIY